MSLKYEPVSVEIESCAPSYEQGTPVGQAARVFGDRLVSAPLLADNEKLQEQEEAGRRLA